MILLLEDLHPEAEALLVECGLVVRAAVPRGTPAEVLGTADAQAIRAILTRGRGRVDAALIDACPSLEVIARPGAGTDNLAVAHASARGVVTIHAPGVNAATVAEHTMALLLAVVRGVVRTATQVRQGRWAERAAYEGGELGGMTLGIVGFGAIGQRVAALAEAFGMRVLVAAHRSVDDPRATPLDDLLADADAVTLHLPLGESTRGLLDADRIAAMKPGAYLVNTARAGLLDGAAVRQALADGQLAGFAADLLEQEPPDPDDPLLSSDRAVVTPHVAALTGATYRRMCLQAAENVAAVLRGEAADPRSIAGA